MSKIKLTYFGFNGGRGEPVRMALAIGGIVFEDIRINFEQFREQQTSFPLHAVPTMEVDGVVHTQSNAMTRYAGKLAGLYPNDPWQAFLCDEILEITEDASVAMVKTFGLEGDAMQEARENLVSGPFTRILKLLDARLENAGGGYFSDGQLTVADLKAFVWLRSLSSGILDHVPTDLTSQVVPKLTYYMNRVAAEPRVADYLAKLS